MKNFLLKIAGFIALSLGAVGAILPIMPTVPFVLIAAACFSVSSPRMYNKLLQTKYFGEFIQNYKNKNGLSRRIKIFSIVYLWIALGVSVFFSKNPYVGIILLVVGMCVTIHIISIKTKKKE